MSAHSHMYNINLAEHIHVHEPAHAQRFEFTEKRNWNPAWLEGAKGRLGIRFESSFPPACSENPLRRQSRGRACERTS